MKIFKYSIIAAFFVLVSAYALYPTNTEAALTLTSGSNATTTPNVATAITGFQIVGPAASTTPVQLRTTSGTLTLGTTTGLTFVGPSSGSTINFSGTVANINNALSTLTYTRASTGSDTLEVSLVNQGEIFFTDNGHLYSFVAGSYSWGAAKTAAEALTAYGASGYLVTISSSTENAFVSARLTGDGWIGASDSETEGTWKWMTGPDAGTAFWQGTSGGSAVGGRYSAWAGGEPNQAGEEDCAETYVSSGTWNDFPCGAGLGYVVEFGAPGNLPTVVAVNVSIVTADVPAVTSLSPANGSINISPNANLTIGFSKAVTKSTANILIKKSSDNSTVETINASSSQVTGSGSTLITIDPATTLTEGEQYYVIIPNTAFKDGSNNFFDGISGTSTWNFTIGDFTGPIISSTTASVGTSTATVTWTTNELSSTRLYYGFSSSYSTSTVQTDTSPRVLSHSVPISNLVACATYHYSVMSTDASSNTSSLTDKIFTTAGCVASTTPSVVSTNSYSVNTVSTTTLAATSSTITVVTPSNFTSTSSSVVIQIQSLPSSPVLTNLGKPVSMSSVGDTVFDVKAIINSTTILDSFNTPVTMTYQYSESDIAGLNESTLWLYHYHSGVWSALDNCSINTTTNTITCTAPSFSVFGLFGQVATSVAIPNAGGSIGYACSDPYAKNFRQYSLTTPVACVYTVAIAEAAGVPAPGVLNASTSSFNFLIDLKRGMTHPDVKLLQQYLNAEGFFVATSTDSGSLGYETNYFGTRTKNAVAAFQAAHNITPSVGYFGPITRAYINLK